MCICVYDAPTVGTKEFVSFQEPYEFACIVESSGSIVQQSRNILVKKCSPFAGQKACCFSTSGCGLDFVTLQTA